MRFFKAGENVILSTLCEAAEVNSNGVMWVQSDGQILGLNKALTKELGYPLDDDMPNTIFEINPKMSLLSWRKLWKKMELEEKVSIESEYITSDNAIYPIKLKGVVFNVQGAEYAMLVSENLMESNRYQELLEFTSRIVNVGSWEWDLLNQELFFNEEMYDLVNIPINSKITPDTLQDFISNNLSGEPLAEFRENMNAAVSEGQPFEFEFSSNLKGNSKNFIIHVHPVIFEEEPIKVYGALQNVDKVSKRTDDMYFVKYSMDHAQDMIFWLNSKSYIEYVNYSTCQKLGYTQQELIGKHIGFIDKDYKDEADQFWLNLKEQKSIEFETYNHTKSGDRIPVRVVTNYINFKGKELNCAFARDLTKQKERIEVLNISKITLDTSPQMIFWINENGTLKYFNQAFIDKTEYSKDEIKKMVIADFIHNSSLESHKKDWKKLQKVKFIEDVDRNFITKSGITFPVEITISMISDEGTYFYTAICRDVRERKRLEQLATMSKYTLDQSLDMVCWLNEDASFKYYNDAFARTIGFGNKELDAMKFYDLLSGSKIESFDDSWMELKNGANVTNMEVDLKLSNGEALPCEMNISMVKFEDNEFLVAFLRDVTLRKEKETKLNEQFEEVNRLHAAAAAENLQLKQEIELDFDFGDIITRDPNYKRVLRQVEQVADTEATVLILGETGTGKELLARAIHRLSEREKLPLIKVNCGALPENLIESELFGHEKGSFTGAHQQKVGKFERANGGTIFLDEIGELPLDVQSKFLRVLQEGEIERVGGTALINVDVRIIAATNRNLEEEVAKNTFREDLFYRLNVFPIYNIPLRERPEDIPLLIEHFAAKYAKKINKEISEISPNSMNKLMRYDFLGNVRELENLVERAVILAKNKVLTFDLSLSGKQSTESSIFLSMEEMQKKHIVDALKKSKGKVSGAFGAAELLNMNDKTLTSRMKKLGIDKRTYVKY